MKNPSQPQQLKAQSQDIPTEFEEFKNKEKFLPDDAKHYPGIADPSMRLPFSERINLAADDFKAVFENGKATEQAYRDKIKIGLQRFSDLYPSIDTEDRERICHYFEELMDIVGLESSDGLLNNFIYGFDPTKKQ